jgi:hypothetical protein
MNLEILLEANNRKITVVGIQKGPYKSGFTAISAKKSLVGTTDAATRSTTWKGVFLLGMNNPSAT